MKTSRLIWLLLLFAQASPSQTTFTKPSEAYEFAHRDLTAMYEAMRARRPLPVPIPSTNEFIRKAKELCPAFQLDSVSGEELYWLAKLCEADAAKALLAVEQYLAGKDLEHAPDARLVLALLKMRTGEGWEPAWPTFQIILREDPYEPISSQLEIAIDDESLSNPEKALEWSKKRYSILLERNRGGNPGVPPVHASSVVSAGADLVHRYYLAGETEHATQVLGELNGFAKSHPEAAQYWGGEDLNWVNMEMHAAPAITAVKELGGKFGPDLIQPGRVEVLSFFFLGCGTCITEMPRLNDLQKQYGKQKLLVADVTSYELSSRFDYATSSKTDADLEKARLENAPDIDFVISTDGTIGSYGVNAFPVVAFVDKRGRIRFMGRVISFREDESTGRLIRRLVEE